MAFDLFSLDANQLGSFNQDEDVRRRHREIALADMISRRASAANTAASAAGGVPTARTGPLGTDLGRADGLDAASAERKKKRPLQEGERAAKGGGGKQIPRITQGGSLLDTILGLFLGGG